MMVRLCLAVLTAACWSLPLAAQETALTVESIWGSSEFSNDLVSVRWMPTGPFYTAVERDQ